MTAGRSARGVTLIEVIVAVALLAIIALGLTTTLISAQQTLRVSEQWMRATQLAAEGLEQSRAGHSLTAVPDGFTRSVLVTPWNNHAGLRRLEVTVSWDDGAPHSLQLTTLARR